MNIITNSYQKTKTRNQFVLVHLHISIIFGNFAASFAKLVTLLKYASLYGCKRRERKHITKWVNKRKVFLLSYLKDNTSIVEYIQGLKEVIRKESHFLYFLVTSKKGLLFMKNSKPSQPATPPTPTKVIEVGKFYLIHDGSKTGHPGLIIWKDDAHNLYLAIKFGSSSSKENIKFTYPLSKDITTSYFYKRLFLGKRKNFGSIELTKLSILDKDLSDLIKTFDYLNPKYSKDLNSKDRYQYKRGIKKSPHYKGQLSSPKGSI